MIDHKAISHILTVPVHVSDTSDFIDYLLAYGVGGGGVVNKIRFPTSSVICMISLASHVRFLGIKTSMRTLISTFLDLVFD